jgi:MFS transporter, DHA1 family, multidrug resistance protein
MNENSPIGRAAAASTTSPAAAPLNGSDRAGIGFYEFIGLAAALTSIIALSIDIMLPALPAIGEALGVVNENDRQAVITVFALGFGLAQILFGPLSDRFGRRPVLLPGIAVYAAASLAVLFVDDFNTLLVLRLIQGIGAASVRIIVTAIVRDCYGGRDMARVMSYVFTVFMIVPIMAPAVGQAILLVAEWQAIFAFLGAAAFLFAGWTGFRLKETLPVAERIELSFKGLVYAFGEVFRSRLAVGYTLGSLLLFGALFSFIVSIQQVYDSIYGMGDWFALGFALSAVGMAITSILNGRYVQRYGMRLISHGALIAMMSFGAILLVLSLFGIPNFYVANILLACCMLSFGLVANNFNSIAMEPLGHIAGTASSVIGVISFTGGALLGGMIGQAFNGTLIPLSLAFSGFGGIALVIVLITERGKLFVRPVD